jgi:hypothetical protein
MATNGRMARMKRRAVSAASVVVALAIAAPIAAPIAEASAATPTAPRFPALPALPALGALPDVGAFPGYAGAGLAFFGPQVAIGPTVIGSVFNGGTAVIVSNDPPINSGNVIGSP